MRLASCSVEFRSRKGSTVCENTAFSHAPTASAPRGSVGEKSTTSPIQKNSALTTSERK